MTLIKKCKSNHYLYDLVVFHNLRMTQFWSVKYICLVHKLKFLLWIIMSQILGNIYDTFLAIVFGAAVFETVFSSTFWRLWKLVIQRKSF